MAQQFDEYRSTLINNVLLASSQEEVKRFIDTTTQAMEKDNVDRSITPQFINKVINDLVALTPMQKQAPQWDNLKEAKILLTSILSVQYLKFDQLV